jgi:hypothetical protein
MPAVFVCTAGIQPAVRSRSGLTRHQAMQHHLSMPNWLKLALTLLVVLVVLAIFAAPHTDLAESALRAMRFALVFFALLLGVRAVFNRIVIGTFAAKPCWFAPLPAPEPHLSPISVLRC